jgi:hypothetical protein
MILQIGNLLGEHGGKIDRREPALELFWDLIIHSEGD